MEKGTFVKINYTGTLENGTVFDTTDAARATQAHINRQVKPIIICLGQKQLLAGLDSALIGKPLGKHTITLQAEEAFGKKSTKNMELVPLPQLKKQGINPVSGMQLDIDGKFGTVRSISGGRVVVDFNHPLAGQTVIYTVDMLEEVTDIVEQVKSLLENANLPYESVTAKEEHITIKVAQLFPQPIMDAIQQKIVEVTTAKHVSFEQGSKK